MLNRRLGYYSVALSVLVVMLSSCEISPKKEYFQPKNDAEFPQCFNSCKADRFQCRTVIQSQNSACRERYEFFYRVFEKCLSTATVRNRCSKPIPCPGPVYKGCGDRFDICFIGCGGQILIDRKQSVEQDTGVTEGL